MADKVCTGDCIKCAFQQQVYCAAQHGHAVMELFPAVFERLDKIVEHLDGLSGGDIINPLKQAQKDSGADNRESGNK